MRTTVVRADRTPVSVAVAKPIDHSRPGDPLRDELERCVSDLQSAVPELEIDWSTVSPAGQLVVGDAPADCVVQLHDVGLLVGALVDPVEEYDVGL